MRFGLSRLVYQAHVTVVTNPAAMHGLCITMNC